MLAEQVESMEQRVEEITRRMQRERQMWEDQLKEEREENRRQGMIQINHPVPATDEYTYIRSLHQPRSRTLQLEQPERDVVRRGEDESTRMNSDVRNVRHLVEDVDVSNRCMMERRREEELTDRLNSANGLVTNGKVRMRQVVAADGGNLIWKEKRIERVRIRTSGTDDGL
jgi:hypothetical protein